jgi:uncharacterized iron-regulated membrane protein
MRKIIKKLHLWIGFTFAAPVIILGITGSIIIILFSFSDIEKKSLAKNSNIYNSSYEDLNIILKHVSNFNGGEITRITFPESENGKINVRLKDKPQLLVAPNSFDIKEIPSNSFTRIIINIHKNLLVKWGDFIMGFGGVAMLFLSLSGLILWFPKKLSMQSIKLKPHLKGKSFYYNTHAVIGFWTFLFLTIMSFTGIYLSFPNGFAKPVKNFLNVKAFIADKDLTPLNLEKVFTSAENATPNTRINAIFFPSKNNNYFLVNLRMIEAKELYPTQIYLNKSGDILKIKRASDYTLGEKINFLISYLHKNQNMGGLWWVWRGLIFITGFLPAFFVFTGFMLWQKKRVKL